MVEIGLRRIEIGLNRTREIPLGLGIEPKAQIEAPPGKEGGGIARRLSQDLIAWGSRS